MHWDLESFNMPWAWHERIAGGGNVLLAVCLTACLSQALTNCVCLFFRGVPSELSQQLLKKYIYLLHLMDTSSVVLWHSSPPSLCWLLPASCPWAIPRLLQSISKSRWPTCARHRSVCPLSSPSLLTPSTSLTLSLSVESRDVVFFFFITRVWFCVCVLSYTGQLGEARPQKPEQHEHRARSASGSHGN